jgi:formate hydrogenlyase subunit 6/NADH:ubiquinone oxidoreductase subunit I
MLRKIRISIAIVCFALITLLFFDITGTLHQWLEWVAKIQFLPALLALNIGMVVALAVLTLIFGRIYCSLICPLGVFQDIISWVAGRWHKNRFSSSPSLSILRYSALAVFVVAFVAGIGSVVALIEPYSAYGRIASNLFAPIYQLGNNAIAYFAERMNSYMFYSVDVWQKSIITLAIASFSFVAIAILAWRNGRTYCNTICPVGTVLGLLSKFSALKPVISVDKCNNCGLCARNCKASCIDSKTHQIDYSRCVTCMDCIDQCSQSAIKYKAGYKSLKNEPEILPLVTESSVESGNARRAFIATASFFAIAPLVGAQTRKGDGGLAVIKDKEIPNRTTQLTPPGSLGASNFTKHCTACNLCISSCPNQVLRPSDNVKTLMQPEMSYERGYCRPECVKCSEVCPTGAILPISAVDKSAIQIGHAVWNKDRCLVNTDQVACSNCARHCPTGAIQMVPMEANNPKALKMPVINTERCIGCGACENLCPARPLSAICVEGHERHRIV